LNSFLGKQIIGVTYSIPSKINVQNNKLSLGFDTTTDVHSVIVANMAYDQSTRHPEMAIQATQQSFFDGCLVEDVIVVLWCW
jgi:hypothetical protein